MPHTPSPRHPLGQRLFRYGYTIGRAAWTRAKAYEVSSLLTFFLLAGALLAFTELAEEVREGETHEFDRAVLLALRNAADPTDPIGPPWFEEMVRDITGLGSIVILGLISAAAIGFLIIVRKRAAASLVLAAVGGGLLLSSLLKNIFERTRPDLVPHMTEVYTASFPSGHAMLAAVTYLTLGALLARIQPRRRVKAYLLGIAVIVTLIVGCSRIYLGVHWPTDVLAGWCIGAAWAMLCWLVALWLQRRGKVESDKMDSDPPETLATD